MSLVFWWFQQTDRNTHNTQKYRFSKNNLVSTLHCVSLSDLIQSHQGVCPEESVYCENKCGARMVRRLLAQHSVSECPKRKLPCRYCRKEFLYDTIQVSLLYSTILPFQHLFAHTVLHTFQLFFIIFFECIVLIVVKRVHSSGFCIHSLISSSVHASLCSALTGAAHRVSLERL